MAPLRRLRLQADATGTLELVCERTTGENSEIAVRSFAGKDEFGLLVDGLEPHEAVTLFYETQGDEEAASR